MMLPVSALLVVAIVASGVVVFLSVESRRTAEDWSAAIAVEQQARSDVDELWAATLGAVAAGVGQQIDSVARLDELSAELSVAPAPAAPDDSVEEQVGAATQDRNRFAAAVDAAIERSGDSAAELGNELAELDSAHGESVRSSDQLVRALESQGSSAEDAARRSLLLAPLFVLLGGALALLWLAAARRRLHRGLDVPVEALHSAIAVQDREGAPLRPRPGGSPS